MKELPAHTVADNEIMGRICAAADKLQAAIDEVKRQTAIATSAENRMYSKIGECSEARQDRKLRSFFMDLA